MASPLLPEFFALLGIDVFLAISLLACLLDKHFPASVPYIYQFAALFGFGHLMVSKGFMSAFTVETRFWYSIVYLLVAVANVIAVNVYMAIIKKKPVLSGVLSGTVTFPTILVSVFFVSAYVNGVAPALPMLPPIPMEIIYVALVICAAVLGIGIMVSRAKPEALRKLRLRRPPKVEARAVTEPPSSKDARQLDGEGHKINQGGAPAPTKASERPQAASMLGVTVKELRASLYGEAGRKRQNARTRAKPEAERKLRLRRPPKVEARTVTEASGEANEPTEGKRERLRLTPEMLRKIRKAREVKQ